MEYKKYNCNSYNIHTIKTDKFKTVRMEIIFSRTVNQKEMPKFTFLCDLLTDTSKAYPRRKDIAIKLEELYNATFFGTTNKVGNLFTISFILEFIDPNYIKDNEYFNDVLKLPFDIINNPNVKNKEFAIDAFNIVKRRILQEIEAIKENHSKLAINNALNYMDETSPSSFRVIGTTEQVEDITPGNIYDTYEDLFNHSLCDIFVIGNINMDECVKIIKENFKNRVIKMKKLELNVLNKTRKKALKVIESSNFVQSSLVMIYNINDLNEQEKNIAFPVFNYILGSGGITSKLYKNLRTDNSLCYGVKSLYLKYDKLLIIEVSLDKENVSLAEKLIKKSIKEMLQGNYSDEVLADAKKNLIFSLKMGWDNNVSVLNNYVFHILSDLPLIEERINLIKEVKKSDLIKCAKALKLNTIYIQNAGEEND